MNKKVLTLCAAMLLTGSLATIEAASKLPSEVIGVEVVDNSTINFTQNVDLGNDYLLIEDDNVTVNGNGWELKGRIVIKGKNVTVQGFGNILLQNEASNFSVDKNAITVVSSSVTIRNNTFTSKASEKGYMANGVSIFPTETEANIVLEGNTFVGFNNYTNESGGAYSAAFLVSQGLSDWTGLGDGSTITTATLEEDFDIARIAAGNGFEDCSVDFSYSSWATNSEAIQQTQVKPVQGKDEVNQIVVKALIENTDEESEVVFKGTVDEFNAILTKAGANTSNKNVAVQCMGDKDGEGAGNVLFGTATNPDNGLGAVINGIVPAVDKVGDYELIESPSTSQYGLLIITDTNGDPWIVSQEEGATSAKSEQVESIDLADYVHADKALWKMESYTTASGEYQYKFTNKAGEVLKAASSSDTDAKAGIFIPKGNAPYSKYGVVLLDVNDTNGSSYYSYALYKTEDNYFSADQLIDRYGDYFTLDITYKNEKDKDVDVTGEFDGQLYPVTFVDYKAGEAEYTDASTEDKFMLVNEKGNIIVIDKKNPQYTAPTAHGYVFTTITPKEWAERNTPESLKAHDYVAEFQFAYDYNDKVTTEAVTGIEIGGYKVGLEKKGSDIILVADVESNLLDEPVISFKLNAGNGIEANEWLTTPSYYKVEAINKDKNAPHYGKVLGLNEDGQIDWVAPENVDLNQPEGQFAIDRNYNFTNRENKYASPAYGVNPILRSDALYKVEDNVYAVVTPEGIDTLRITPVTTYKSNDGFKRFTAAELNANTYTIAMTELSGGLNIFENHNDKHRVGLDEENATEWRIEMPTVKLVDATEDFTRMAADTVKIETAIQYYSTAEKKWVETNLDPESDYYAPNTELQICTYVLKNTDNGEYLNGKDNSESTGNAYYVCNDDKKTGTRIAFKIEGDSTVNLVPVYGWYSYTGGYTNDWMTGMSKRESEYKNYTSNLYLSNYKIIGATTTATGALKDVYRFTAPSNDVFTINVAEAPTYKKLAQGDKIILTLKENLKDENVLFEDGEFAGMGNRLAHTDINPTLYVDTAYVNRAGNFAYQYLLGVRINRVDTTYQCNVPAHGTHRADTTYGDFLVNMVDSAMANKDVHNNKYQYNGEYKLAFVPGYHTNDTLFFTNKAGEVVSKMEVGNGDFNIAKFAFKMIDEEANEFVVETATGYAEKNNYVWDSNRKEWVKTVASVETKPAYLRWVNDNLVVTENIDNAAVFTMEDSELNATANESINAEGAVSVVATDGAVVIKGAEGKNVVIATILGKVVANETINSDNETIAVPAGIAVVSVDGESFKVVVK